MDYTAIHPKGRDSSDNKTFENVTKLKFLARSIINQIYIHKETESSLLKVFIFLFPFYSIKIKISHPVAALEGHTDRDCLGTGC
jgi:hypothetical protein